MTATASSASKAARRVSSPPARSRSARKTTLRSGFTGEKRSLEWFQEHPNELYVRGIEQPVQVWRHGNGYIGAKSPAAARASRVPFGHPEGYLPAFANLYVNIAATIRAALDGVKPDPLALDFPTVDDGVRGMQFLEAVVKSNRLGGKWVKLPKG